MESKGKQLLGAELPHHGVFGGGRYANSTCHGPAELGLMLDANAASLQALKRRGELP